MDKAFWQSIVSNDFAVPAGYSVSAITPELLELLGALDVEQREGVAYPILESWIAQGHYDQAALSGMLATLLHNLTVGLGEPESDTVFLRAFSVLVVGDVIYYDLTHAVLTEGEVRQALDRVLEYFQAENDLRGHDDEKGWAHASAHTADLLWAFAQHHLLSASDLQRIMTAIAEKITAPVAFVYIYDEDERLTRSVMAVLQRDLLDVPFLTGWLTRFTNPAGRIGWDETFEEGRLMEVARNRIETSARYNSKQFLRSLYFQLRAPGFAGMGHIGQRPAIAGDLLPLTYEALSRIHAWG